MDTWWDDMEVKYQNFVPNSQKNRQTPIRFNRNNMTRAELIELSKQPFDRFVDSYGIKDEELDLPIGNCKESCEPF